MSSSSRLDQRPPLVDLGGRSAGRVDDHRGRARLVPDAHEVVEDRLRRQLLDDARPGASADEAGSDDRNVERLQRARDVDSLAAGERQAGARAVPWPRWKFGTVSVRSSAAFSVTVTISVNQDPMCFSVCPRVETDAPGKTRALDRARRDERARDHEALARVEADHAEPFAGAHGKRDRGRCDDARDERPVDANGAAGARLGDELQRPAVRSPPARARTCVPA